MPFLVTDVGRVAQSGDAPLQWKCARHKKPGTESLVDEIGFKRIKSDTIMWLGKYGGLFG